MRVAVVGGKNMGKLKPADLHPFKSQTSSHAASYPIPLSSNLNLNGGSLIHVIARVALVVPASHRFLPSPEKAIRTGIRANCSLRSLVLALASDQGHTTLFWLIKVPTPHFSLSNGVPIPPHIASFSF